MAKDSKKVEGDKPEADGAPVDAVTSRDTEVQKVDESIRANIAASEGDTSGLTAEQKKAAEDAEAQAEVNQAAADTVEHIGEGPTAEDEEAEEQARNRASKKKLGFAMRLERLERTLGIRD